MGDNAPVNQHHMIHMFFSLQRAACSVNFSLCEQETYTNGYSNYSNWAIELFGYFNTFSAPVQWLVTAFSGVIFASGALSNNLLFPRSSLCFPLDSLSTRARQRRSSPPNYNRSNTYCGPKFG